MKDTKLDELIEVINAGGGFLPRNQPAHDLLEATTRGEVITLNEVTARDLKRHKCYMALLKEVYGYLPQSFQKKVPAKHFYQFVKHVQGKYKVLFTFNDGSKMIEYESISFAKMSEIRFRQFIKEQMPFIYTEIIGAFFEGEIYNSIVDTIEENFEKFFLRL